MIKTLMLLIVLVCFPLRAEQTSHFIGGFAEGFSELHDDLEPKQMSFWRPKVKQMGDPKANYLNVEFTSDGKYMVWFEGSGGSSVNGIVWHCGIDQKTGELIPPDGRGFRAFESTSWGRANPGCDKLGSYYVGADKEGKLIMVRPNGPNHGTLTTLLTPADTRRRAIYPTCLPDRQGGFVLFIQNEKAPGAGIRAKGNSWVELQYVDLADPAKVNTVERQTTPPLGFAPMDVGFVRWMRGRPLMTYGSLSERTGKVEIRAFDADHPQRKSFELICDGRYHIDPHPAVLGEYEYIFTGIDGAATSHVYRRPAGRVAETPFELFKMLSPEQSRLAAPSLAQSHEPFLFEGRLYTVYQVNDKGRNFFETTFRKAGEIWMADLSSEPIQQWLIAPDGANPVAEPEPLVTRHGVWVFYNRPMIGESLSGEADGSIRDRVRRRLAGATGGGEVPRLTLYRAEVPLYPKK